MATIIISDLQPIEEKTFLSNLNSEQVQQILGGIPFLPFLGSSGTQLTTIYDGINATQSTNRGPFGFYDNKIFTLDFARTSIYLVV
ncbi:MAG: hypothetical protein HCA25_15875 [Dolichospermum sp. DET50]|nr:hypothetical protein [Dolichospermum sp. DET66]MBS3033707.1 hypothetical protein [Dolichospermum sp. DET67]MBS3038910.1 hypothetical protein [Dolichospermum sp. DET50]QSX66166.1 MAG: hypothetical protein EZY12_15140 [Dolichospermum sp. DET69]